MDIKHLRASDYRQMAWKNGGGSTAEIAVHPDHAGMDDFDWRISMAHVASDGPFSRFVGIDRTLTLLDGNGIRLRVEETEYSIIPSSPVLSFQGDQDTEAWLNDGPITDLNVMTRRGKYQHNVQPMHYSTRTEFALPTSDFTVIVSLADDGQLALGATNYQLAKRDCLLIAAGKPTMTSVAATGDFILISLGKSVDAA